MIFRPLTVWIGGLCKGYIMNAYLGLRGELLFWWLVLCCLTHLCLTADFVSWFLCFFIAEILGHRLDEHCILDEAWWLNWWNEWNSQLWTESDPGRLKWIKTRFKLFFPKAHSFLHIIYIYIACTYKHFYPSWTDLGSFSSRFPLRFWVQYLEPLPCGRGHRLWKLWRKTRRWRGTFWWGKKPSLVSMLLIFLGQILSNGRGCCFRSIFLFLWYCLVEKSEETPQLLCFKLGRCICWNKQLGVWKTGRSFPFGARRSFGA